MPKQNTISRSLHDIGLAAWFGGSLMGAVGVNGASAEVANPTDRTRVANAGWSRWTPVNAAAIAAYVIGSVPIIWSNKGRLLVQPQARWVNATKGALTLAALGVTGYARYEGEKVMEAGREGQPVEDATTPSSGTDPRAASAQRQLTALQWAVPALTGGLLALNAKAGEQQRPSVIATNAIRARVDDLQIPNIAASTPGGMPTLVGVLLGVLTLRRLRKGRKQRRREKGTLRARDIMTPSPECVDEHDTLETAARKLAALDVGALPVCGADKRLKGMVTDRDIVVSVVSAGRDPKAVTVAELANGKPVTIGADDSIDEAIRTMKRHQVRRLPVIDGQALVGMVSQADLAANAGDAKVGDLVEAISVD